MCVAERETKLGLIQVVFAEEGDGGAAGESFGVGLVADSLGAGEGVVIPSQYSSAVVIVVAATTTAVVTVVPATIQLLACAATVCSPAATGR